MVNNLFSPELEQSILAVLLQFPETYSEISWLNNKDFSKVNGPIFSVIQQIIESKGRPDTVIVAERLKSIGISLDGIDIGTYLETLRTLRNVEPKNVTELAKELKKKTLIRRVVENCDSLKRDVVANQEKSGKELIEMVDNKLGNSLLDLGGNENIGTNLYETLGDDVEARANEGADTNFINHCWPSVNRCLGPYLNKNLYTIVSRRGTGKSLVLMSIATCIQSANTDPISVLFLDTEMDVAEFQKRNLCSRIGVPYHLLNTNLWRYDAEWCPKVRAELKKIKEGEKNIWFEPVGNMSISGICNFIKSWRLKQGREKKCLVILDQFKISSKTKSEAGNSSREYETAYFACEALKDVADYCNCPILFALQANAQGVYKGRSSDELADNDTIASLSDRVSFLVNHMLILRGRTHDEMLADTTPTAIAPSHKLIHIKVRNGGELWPFYDKWVRIKEGKEVKYRPNFISLDLSNFSVRDCGIYSDMLEAQGRISKPLPVDKTPSPI